jgi:pimeloyl-ACP methyl ester carboxylesterase
MAAAGSYILVHGGGMTARFWDRLVPELDRPALAVDLPGRNDQPGDLGSLTVGEEAASVVADVRRSGIAPPYVVVAHSSGGLVVPEVVAALAPAVSRIVLNAASVPPEGGCGLDCMKQRHREGILAALEHGKRTGTTITTPGSPRDPEEFRSIYGGPPLDDDTLAFVVDRDRCVRDTMHHYLQPVRWSIASDVPVTYVLNELDRPVPPTLQEAMIARLPRRAAVVPVDTGHIPAVTHAPLLAEIVGRQSSRRAVTGSRSGRSTQP